MAQFQVALQDVSLKIRNFKCFSETKFGFDSIKPINVIIGRNNSGKTTLLDLIDHVTENTDISTRGHKGRTPQAILSFELSDVFLVEHLPTGRIPLSHQNYQWELNPQAWARNNLVGKRIVWEVSGKDSLSFIEVTGFDDQEDRNRLQLNWVANQLQRVCKHPFAPFRFQRIVADRDIDAEVSDATLAIQPNGAGVTNAIQRHINADSLDRDIIETTLLNELNSIFRPDADYSRLLVEQRGTGHWEIHLEEPLKGRVPMSQTGSGLKTVLLVLSNLLLVLLLGEQQQPLSSFLFGFEELENNLHPAIQRRLFRYLRTKAIQEGCRFFVTTHSNVVIDLFSDDEHAQLLHVTHDGESASVASIGTSLDGHNVLEDLDIRASDLLQTNVVVWVEGPSDRFYFSRWIELWSDGELVEGVHFQCLPYGGSLNAHLSFEAPECVDELISALKINRHAILLADSDKRADGDELKPHTCRLSLEIEAMGGYSWITFGKEVENYIPVSVYQQMLNNESLRGPGRYADAFSYIARHKDSKAKPRKVDLAHKVVPLLTRESVAATPDLGERLSAVCQLIRKWNRIGDGSAGTMPNRRLTHE